MILSFSRMQSYVESVRQDIAGQGRVLEIGGTTSTFYIKSADYKNGVKSADYKTGAKSADGTYLNNNNNGLASGYVHSRNSSGSTNDGMYKL